MTGTQLILNWINEFIKINGESPSIDKVKAQLQLAIDNEKYWKTISTG